MIAFRRPRAKVWAKVWAVNLGLGLLLLTIAVLSSAAAPMNGRAAATGLLEPARSRLEDITGPLQEGFESGTLNAFRSFVPLCPSGGCDWRVVTDTLAVGHYAAFAPNIGNYSDQQLVLNRPIAVPAGALQATLSFRHRFEFEAPRWDGGVLEVSTNNGSSWQDAGPNMTQAGYNGTIAPCCNNPLAGRAGWVGSSGGAYTQTVVNLLPYAGQNIIFHFRLGTDSLAPAPGWWIDDIRVSIATTTVCGPPTWGLDTPYPNQITKHTLVEQGGFLWSFGGEDANSVTSAAFRFVPGGWAPIAPLPAARQQASAATDGRFIYILGGFDQGFNRQTTLFRFDPLNNAYTVLAPEPLPSQDTTLAYLEGRLFVIGSLNAQGQGTLQIFNIATNSWTVQTVPSGNPSQMLVAYGGLLYAAGGGTGGLKTARFDPATNIWNDAAITDLPLSWSRAASGLYGSRWIIAGGEAGGVQHSPSVIALDLNTPTGAWTALPDLLEGRNNARGVALGQSFYVVGGFHPNFNGEGTNSNQRLTDVPCVPCNAAACATLTPTATRTSTPTPTRTPTRTLTATPTATPTCPFPVSTPGPWAVRSPVPVAARGQAAASDGLSVYVAGGRLDNGAVLGNFTRYDAAPDTWTPLTALLSPASGVALVFEPVTKRIYAFGGFNGTTAIAGSRYYDLALQSWQTASSLPAPRYLMGAAYWNGRIYLAGGFNDASVGTEQQQLWEFNPATGSYTTLAPLPAAWAAGGAGIIAGRFYLAGGRTGGGVSTAVFQYNLATNAWSGRAALPQAAYAPGSAAVGGRYLWVFGGAKILGSDPHAPTSPLKTTYIYDTATDTWATGPALNVGRGLLGGAVAGNTVVAVGGANSSNGLAVTEVNAMAGGACLTPTSTPTATRTPSG